MAEPSRYQKRQERRDSIRVWLEALTLIGVAIYAGLTYCLLKSNQSANRLNYIALKNSQGAFFRVDPPSPNWTDPNQPIVEFTAVNEGALRANDFKAEIEFLVQTLPDRKTLVSEKYSVGGKGTTVKPNSPIQKSLPLPTELHATQEQIDQMKEVIILKGTLSYDDGLREPTTQTFCISEMRWGRPAPKGDWGYPTCDEIPSLIRQSKYGNADSD